MLAFKRIVTVAVMVYLLLALLFLLFPAVRSSVAGLGSEASAVEQERSFFYVLCWVGIVVLGLQLVAENLDSSLLRRTVAQQDNKINELKAKLYDTHATTAASPASSAVAYPTAASAAASERELRRPDEPTATSPTI